MARGAVPARPRWYLVQVPRGREASVAALVTSVMPQGALAEPVFVPSYVFERKVRGRWVRAEKPLLNGYAVAVTSQPRLLDVCCRRLSAPARPLADPLPRALEPLFGGLGAPGARRVPMSVARKLGDEVYVVDGPLARRADLVGAVDRRRSLARLEVVVGGERVCACVGLAVLPAPEGWSPNGLEPVRLSVAKEARGGGFSNDALLQPRARREVMPVS